MSGAARAKTEPRAWQRMLSGRRLDLLDPSPLDVELIDAEFAGDEAGEQGVAHRNKPLGHLC